MSMRTHGAIADDRCSCRSFVTAAPAESSAVGAAVGAGAAAGAAGSYATARQLPPGYAESFATAAPGGTAVAAPVSGPGSFATAVPADQSVAQVQDPAQLCMYTVCRRHMSSRSHDACNRVHMSVVVVVPHVCPNTCLKLCTSQDSPPSYLAVGRRRSTRSLSDWIRSEQRRWRPADRLAGQVRLSKKQACKRRLELSSATRTKQPGLQAVLCCQMSPPRSSISCFTAAPGIFWHPEKPTAKISAPSLL